MYGITKVSVSLLAYALLLKTVVGQSTPPDADLAQINENRGTDGADGLRDESLLTKDLVDGVSEEKRRIRIWYNLNK